MHCDTQDTVLIAGGAGFIGSHLCEAYLNRGSRVLCMDNFYTGSRANIAPFCTNPNFRVIEHDIINPLPLDLPKTPNLILNFACPASPVHYQRDPLFTFKTCILGTLNLLELTRRNPHATYVQASTSEVYGDPLVSPQPESYWGHVNPMGVRSCYDEGKRAAETLCHDFSRHYTTDVRVVRIFNTYGPRMQPDDGRAISNFVVKALRQEPMEIYGDGQQTRSFCYITDLVRGILALAQHERSRVQGPYNLGNGEELCIGNLAALVKSLTASSSPIIHLPPLADDPKCRRPDLTKSRAEFNWRAQIPLADGLRATINYFKNLLSSAGKATTNHESQSNYSHL